MNIYVYLLIFFCILIIRFYYFISKFIFLKKVLKNQDIYVKGSFKDASEKEKEQADKSYIWLEERQIEIKKIILSTNAKDHFKSYMEPIGYHHVQQKNVSALDNITFINSEIQLKFKQITIRARGFYKINALKSFYPTFWIHTIVFLPKNILNFISINNEVKYGSFVIKFFQLIYWILSIFLLYKKLSISL